MHPCPSCFLGASHPFLVGSTYIPLAQCAQAVWWLGQVFSSASMSEEQQCLKGPGKGKGGLSAWDPLVTLPASDGLCWLEFVTKLCSVPG